MKIDTHITLCTWKGGGSTLGTVCMERSEDGQSITVQFATFLPGGGTLTPPCPVIFSKKEKGDYEFIIPVWRQSPGGTTSATITLNQASGTYVFVRGNTPQQEDDICKISDNGLQLSKALDQLFGFC